MLMAAPTPLAWVSRPRSANKPSETSIMALARPRRETPNSSRGSGLCRRAEKSGGGASPAFSRAKAQDAAPNSPLRKTASPGRAPSRRMACPSGHSPNSWMTTAKGPRLRSPPTNATPWRRASSASPRLNPDSQASSSWASDRVSTKVIQRGAAPMAAMSLRLTAKLLWPMSKGSASGKKCVPATRASVETASSLPAGTDNRAPSSPMPSNAPGPGGVNAAKCRWMMSNSFMGRQRGPAPGRGRAKV